MARPKGYVCSAETKARIAEAQRKRLADPAALERMSEALRKAYARRKAAQQA